MSKSRVLPALPILTLVPAVLGLGLFSSCGSSSWQLPQDITAERIVLQPSDFEPPIPFRNDELAPILHEDLEPPEANVLLLGLGTYPRSAPYVQILELLEYVTFYRSEAQATRLFAVEVREHELLDDPDCFEPIGLLSCCSILANAEHPANFRRTASSGVGDETAIYECLWYGLGRTSAPSPDYHTIARVGVAVIHLDINYEWGFSEQRIPNDDEARALLSMAAAKVSRILNSK